MGSGVLVFVVVWSVCFVVFRWVAVVVCGGRREIDVASSVLELLICRGPGRYWTGGYLPIVERSWVVRGMAGGVLVVTMWSVGWAVAMLIVLALPASVFLVVCWCKV